MMEGEPIQRKREEEPPVAGWQTIYCSLALILVAFFAMLVTYSKIEVEKVKVFTEGRDLIMDRNPLSGLDMMMLSRKIAAERERRVMVALQALNAYLERAGLADSVYTEISSRGFTATFASHLLFPSAVAEISKEAYPGLNEIARIAKEGSFSLSVEGHTDNVPIRTPQFPSNWELSTTRAVNVLRYLREKGDVSAERLSAVGFAQYQPLVSNDTPEARQKNRRVVFHFELENNAVSGQKGSA